MIRNCKGEEKEVIVYGGVKRKRRLKTRGSLEKNLSGKTRDRMKQEYKETC